MTSHSLKSWGFCLEMPQIVAKIAPNNEIRLVAQSLPAKLPCPGDSPEDRRRERCDRAEMEAQVNRSGDKYPQWGMVGLDGSVTWVTLDHGDWVQRWEKTLDLTKKVQQSNLDNPKESCRIWRKKTFHANARGRLLAGGSVMDESKSRVAMLTLTIPGSGSTVGRVVASFSSFLMNRLLQVVRRSTNSSKWMYCWEFQKRGMLHLHLAIQTNCDEETWRLCRRMRTMWYRCLRELSLRHEVDLFRKNGMKSHWNNPRIWQWDIQWVRKSVGAYLSKYLSKQAREGVTRGFGSGTSPCYPSRFWGMSRSLSQEVRSRSREMRVTMTRSRAKQLLASLRDYLSDWVVQTYSYSWEKGHGVDGRPARWGDCEVFYVEPSMRDRLQRGIFALMQEEVERLEGGLARVVGGRRSRLELVMTSSVTSGPESPRQIAIDM